MDVTQAAQGIADAMAPTASAPSARWRWGTVVSVGAGTMTVEVGGTPIVGVRCAEHVMGASVGDRVRVAYYGTDAIVDAVRAATTDRAPFAFNECATEETTIASGGCVEVTAPITTISGYTRRGVVQTWATGTGNVIVGSQHCSGSSVLAKVRANNAATVVVHFYILHTRD